MEVLGRFELGSLLRFYKRGDLNFTGHHLNLFSSLLNKTTSVNVLDLVSTIKEEEENSRKHNPFGIDEIALIMRLSMVNIGWNESNVLLSKLQSESAASLLQNQGGVASKKL